MEPLRRINRETERGSKVGGTIELESMVNFVINVKCVILSLFKVLGDF